MKKNLLYRIVHIVQDLKLLRDTRHSICLFVALGLLSVCAESLYAAGLTDTADPTLTNPAATTVPTITAPSSLGPIDTIAPAATVPTLPTLTPVGTTPTVNGQTSICSTAGCYNYSNGQLVSFTPAGSTVSQPVSGTSQVTDGSTLVTDGSDNNSLCMNSTTGQGADLYNSAQNTQPTSGGGYDIISAIFTAVNSIMNQMAQRFYTGVVGNTDYQNAVNAAVLLYILVYGIMITLNLASYRTGEVVARLAKIGIVYGILTGGWQFFSYYVGDPVINGMNQLIAEFAVASSGPLTQPPSVQVNGQLSTASMTMMMGPISLVFSTRFIVLILALLSTGAFGWFYAFMIIWGLIEFIMVLIGAIVTYIKAIVGLAFLFGIAPIFFAFILFERSRQIFQGWLNQVLGFALQPVLLFAFLGFYGSILTLSLLNLMFPGGVGGVDFCWQKFVPLGIFDIWWWRPVEQGLTGSGGDWNPANPPPVSLIDILYFLLLTHLGKNLAKFIEQLSRDLSGGGGPGIVRGSAVGQWFSNNLPGANGRGIGGVAMDTGHGMFKMVGNRLNSFVENATQTETTGGGGAKKDSVKRVGGEGYSDMGGGDSGGGNGPGGGSGPDNSGTDQFISDTTISGGRPANNAVPFNRSPVGGTAGDGYTTIDVVPTSSETMGKPGGGGSSNASTATIDVKPVSSETVSRGGTATATRQLPPTGGTGGSGNNGGGNSGGSSGGGPASGK